MTRLRLADRFVVAPPAKAVAKTRLGPSPADEEVLLAVGRHLGSLLRSDVAERCRLGAGPKHAGRADRKRALTPECSSRWAGAITRTADEMHALAVRNLKALAERDAREVAEIDRRSALPTADRLGDVAKPKGRRRGDVAKPKGRRRGDVAKPKGRRRCGYANQAERHHKQRRRHWLEPLNQSRRQRGDGHAAAVVIGRRSQGHSEKRRHRTHPTRPEDRCGRTSTERTADTTGMATATGNDGREHPRDATTARPDTRPAARTGVQHRSGRRRQNNHLSV